jgi:hypothetical protein
VPSVSYRTVGQAPMTRRHEARRGEGTAWLVADGGRHDFVCYWYNGPSGDRLADHARVATAAEAVAWGRGRTPRVRIRMADGLTYWAGTATRPRTFSHSWIDAVGVRAGAQTAEAVSA